MTRRKLKTLCFGIAAATILGLLFVSNPPGQLWMYFGVAIAAGDQIYTRVDRGNGQYEEATLLLAVSAVTMLYLPPSETVWAIALGSSISMLFAAHILWYKRALNVLILCASGAIMAISYTGLNSLFNDAVWPSIASAIAMLVSVFVFDVINVSILSAIFLFTTETSLSALYMQWERSLTFPLISGVIALLIGVLASFAPLLIPMIPILLVVFLKPAYTAPKFLVAR